MFERFLIFAAMEWFLMPILSSASSMQPVHIDIVDLHSDRGVVRCFLYNSEKGFPKDQSLALATASGTISAGKSSCDFASVPDGTYAVSIFHDENANRRLDTNFLGIPKEGVGASNDAKGRMGPPDFKDAKFQVAGKAISMTIRMHYL